ncbi:MAG: putative addiction module antidote protein [Nitrospinae bacterium]|nr:putative addiction module antidote protein [Nitrospinota bacterium]
MRVYNKPAPLKRNKNHPPSASYDEGLRERLMDEKFAQKYLELAMEESEKVFLAALRNYIAARNVKIVSLAKNANISRDTLYKALTPEGNPRWSTIMSIMHGLGLKLTPSYIGR